MTPSKNRLKISTVVTIFFDNGASFNLFTDVISSLENQTFQPYEVIISDDSKKVNYKSEIIDYLSASELNASYIRNFRKQGVGGNSNNGILRTSGDIVHVIHMDDQLYDETIYMQVEDFFSVNQHRQWIFFAGFANNQIQVPVSNDFVCFGQNSFGGPSGLFTRTESKILYDEKLRMYVDTDLVSRLIQEHPVGEFSKIPGVVYGVGPWQIQRNTTAKELISELEILVNKSYVTENLIKKSRWALKGSSYRRNLSVALYNQGKISILDRNVRLFFANLEEKFLALRFHVLGKGK